jgi:hypothetical protein
MGQRANGIHAPSPSEPIDDCRDVPCDAARVSDFDWPAPSNSLFDPDSDPSADQCRSMLTRARLQNQMGKKGGKCRIFV